MAIVASIYGRLGKEPKQGTTKTGKDMTTAAIAVDVGREGEADSTLWVSILAFGANSEKLVKHQPGDMVAVTGRLGRGKFTGRDGLERECWSMMADSLHSSRTVRPGNAGVWKNRQVEQIPATVRYQPDTIDFDDDMPF